MSDEEVRLRAELKRANAVRDAAKMKARLCEDERDQARYERDLCTLHEEGIEATLGKLGVLPNEETISVGVVSLRNLLREVFHLRWQNRQLQARGTELVEEGRAWKRKAKAYGDALAFVGRAVGGKANKETIRARFPELFRTIMEQAADEHLTEVLDDIQAKDAQDG